MSDDLVNALRRIAKVSYGATIEEARSVSKTQRDAADLIEQQAAKIAELTLQIAALTAPVAPAVDAQPVAHIRTDHLQQAKRAPFMCRVHPASQGAPGMTALYATPQSEGWRKALTEIAEQEHIELMLDPTWAQRVAVSALSQKEPQ